MIPWENLRLWYGYPLRDGSWLDVSKHLNNGAIIGGGWVENGIYFDGIDDYVNCGSHSSLKITDVITMEAWIKWDTFTTFGVINAYTGVANCWVCGSHPSGADYVSAFRIGTPTDQNLLGTTVLNTGQWYYLVAVYDKDAGSNNMRLYLDGVLENQTTKTGTMNIFSYMYIGRYFSSYFKGVIAQARIYNIALTAEQIHEAYEQGI